MARISTFPVDTDIGVNDILVGSEYNGIGANNRPVYITKNYRVGDLSTFFGLNSDGIALNTTKLSSLATYNNDGSVASLQSATVSLINTATTAAGFATSSSVTTLTSSVNLKPNIFRQTSVPTALAPRDIWFDTDDGNRMYVATAAGDDQVTSGEWEETTDTRLAAVVTSAATATTNITTLTNADTAKAAQITELNSQFTFSGGDITGVADALNTSINTAASTAVSATASSLDKLEALFTFDGSNNVNGLAGGTTISSSIATSETNAISTANKASATREDNLSASVGQLFEQTSQPTVTAAVSMTANVNGATSNSVDLVIDGQSSGTITTGMTITGTGISGDVVVITVTDQNTLVISSPQTLSNNVQLTFAKPQTPPDGSVWYDTTSTSRTVKNPTTGADTTTSVPKNKLYILKSGSWVVSPDATMPTQASVNTISSATADITGNLSAAYGVQVNAGGAVAGMKLLADGTTGSEIVFQADKFKIQTGAADSGTSATPFTVSGTTVSINGTLQIGGTTLTDVTSKANAATTASAAAAAANSATKTLGAIGPVTITSTTLQQGSGGFQSASAGFFMNSNGEFSLRDKLSVDSSGNLSIAGAISATSGSIANGVTIGGTAASTVASGAASGATANQTSTADIRAVGAATSGTIAGISISGSELYQGSGNFGQADTGFYLGSNGTFSLKDKLTWNGTTLTINGNGTFSGALSAASGSFSGAVTASSGTIGNIVITADDLHVGTGNWSNADTGFFINRYGFFSLTDQFTYNPTFNRITINANATFAGTLNGADGNFSGEISAATGDIGGWDISEGVLASSDSDVKINSSTGSSGIEMFDSGNLRVKISPSGSVSNPLVSSNISIQTQAVRSSNFGLILNSTVFAGSFVNTSGNPTTINLRTNASANTGTIYYNDSNPGQIISTSANATVAYTLTIPATSSVLSVSAVGTLSNWSVSCIVGVRITTSITPGSGTTIADHSSTASGTSLSASTSQKVFSGSFVATTTSAYYVHTYIKKVVIAGILSTEVGSNTSVTAVNIKQPSVTPTGSVAIQLSELTSGGLLVSKGTDAFLRVDRSSNSSSSPFIKSRGFMEHQGRLTVLNSSGTSGTGDIYLGGTNSNNSGYMRLFSDANSHKYIEWGDATSNSAFQLKLRYNGNQKFQFGSTGVFDAVSTKNFKINHLLESKEETYYLRHAAIEGPQADLIYRGKVNLSNGTATVNLDEAARMSEGTFVLLCRDIQCFTSNETGWDAVKASVSNNTLTINCQNTNSSDEISWMVIAERKDPSYINSDVTDENGLYKTESEKED